MGFFGTFHWEDEAFGVPTTKTPRSWLLWGRLVVDAQEAFGVPTLKRLAFDCGDAAQPVMMRCNEV